MALHDRDTGFEPVGQHRPPPRCHQGDGGDLLPGQERALSRAPKDHALLHELEAWPHRAAHREEADDRRQDGGPTDATAAEEEDDAAELGHAGQRQEERPGQASIDDGTHTTTRTPPATISARRTLPR